MNIYKKISDTGDKVAFRPLKEIYFTKNRIKDSTEEGNWTVTFLFLLLGIIILAVALINFVNFSIALAPVRIKELNTHKTFGASAALLRLYIFSEALVFSFLSAIIGLLICTSLANTGMQSLFVFSLNPFENFSIILFITGVSLIAGLLAGFYPAFYMTSFAPAVATKGTLALSPTGVKFRNTLVVFQYTVSM
ncbi:MAG: FtsX-like permease family protein, partial [Odoribacter sp.]|nr:FtsX-like permease family protein [Odoribacter sp.]